MQLTISAQPHSPSSLAENLTPAYNFACLGPWQAWDREGEPLTWRGHKATGLLAYLCTRREYANSRDELLALFWPELPEAQARNNLRVTLARLNQTLRAVGPGFLETNRATVEIAADASLWFDAETFHQIDQQTRRHAHETRASCPNCRPLLTHAVDLYRGEFLAGYALDNCPDFDEWLGIQREHYHVQVAKMLDELAEFHAETGEFDIAETMIRRRLALDPLHESGWRQLMRVLDAQGNRTTALVAFHTCRKTLATQLGIEPEPETQQLYAQLYENRQSTLPAAPPGAPQGASGVASPTGTNGSARKRISQQPSLPHQANQFFGREHELTLIGERFAQGVHRLITLCGPGGIGKTRLALQIAHAYHDHFADGVAFVPLAAVQNAADIPTAIIMALDPALVDTRLSPLEYLLNLSAHRQMLLIIDNIEHLMDGAEILLTLLKHAPGVTLLVTSRERLNAQTEDLFVLEGLSTAPVASMPDADRAATDPAAMRLFVDRAYQTDKSFAPTSTDKAHILDICRLVDGLPLAIELAATWVRDYTCPEIAQAIVESMDFLQADFRDLPPPPPFAGRGARLFVAVAGPR